MTRWRIRDARRLLARVRPEALATTTDVRVVDAVRDLAAQVDALRLLVNASPAAHQGAIPARISEVATLKLKGCS